MSKPLVLTIYPHVIDGGMDCIEDAEGTLRTGRELDDFADDKTLTEAELAAEYWSQALAGCINPNSFRTYAGVEVRGTESDRIATLHRFATLPHYEQEQP